MTSTFPIVNRAALPAGRFAALVAEVGGHRSIKRALDWSLGQFPPVAPADVIAQDEFSHDVLIGLTDPPGCWLVYDCT